MSLIKPILIAAILLLMLWAFRYRRGVGMRAGIKVIALTLTGLAIAAVADPGITQTLANTVGVTRGTDLLLYVVVVVFGFTQAGVYFRFRDVDLRVARAIRAQAIQEAVVRDGPPGSSVTTTNGEL